MTSRKESPELRSSRRCAYYRSVVDLRTEKESSNMSPKRCGGEQVCGSVTGTADRH